MLFFYIRHGDPIYSPDSLTPQGERQAEALSRRLGLFGLDEVYVSSSMRAKLTAKPTCEILKIEPAELDWCNENHAWAQLALPTGNGNEKKWMFDQTKYKTLFVSEEIRRMGEEWYMHPAFDGTEIEAGIERIRRGCDDLMSSFGYEHDREKHLYTVRKDNNRRVALFAHQGFGLAFLSALLDIPYPEFSTHFDLGHSSMTVINFENCDGICIPKVCQSSNDSHLYKQDLPLNYNNRLRF